MSELAWLFLRLGTISFGGPAAHIALMQEEVVRRRKWLDQQEFLDLLGATNLIPGPNSTELAIHIGHRRAGWPGLLIAGVCFILPAALIVTFIAWAYVTFGSRPQASGLLYGIKPAMIAVIAQALIGLGKTAVKTRWLALLGSACVLAVALGANELAVLFAAGLLWMTARVAAPGSTLAAVVPFGLMPLFLFFAKIGSVLFGSGYVLLAFLRADLVERWHWLTEAQLLDAIAVGQVTPGPVFTTATFIGYVLGGAPGALVATIGIFLPAFIFVALSGPLVPRIRKSRAAGAFLDGVNVASLALMAVVTSQLARAAVIDWITLAIAAASAVAVFWFRVNSAWLVLGAGAAGLMVAAL
ncbi:MAG TPA: chromate transporter [Bryobacteraceae bacterium]|nr:chromate transporter [Bryobacteraceae bacterium]